MEKIIQEPRGAKLGDYVTVKLRGEEDTRQGVLVGKDEHGNPLVKGQLEDYVGEGDTTVVPDKNLFTDDVREHVAKVRAELSAQEQTAGK